jgi:hypothetical protein
MKVFGKGFQRVKKSLAKFNVSSARWSGSLCWISNFITD